MKDILISPSILSCDYGRMADELQKMENSGADLMHIDVMDGHFVPNITLGAPVISCIKNYTSVPFDVHLMISDPLQYIDDFVDAGADIITIHLESNSDIQKTLSCIKEKGCKSAISVKPKTPVEDVFEYLDEVSMVLIMTVEPGFGGQGFMLDMLPKIERLKAEIDKRGLNIDIQVDGGINEATIALAAKSGANVFVSGNAIFKSRDTKATIENLKEIAKREYPNN